MKQGDRITWKDINLSCKQFPDEGMILSIKRTPRGGDCYVKWDKYPSKKIEECMNNLQVIK